MEGVSLVVAGNSLSFLLKQSQWVLFLLDFECRCFWGFVYKRRGVFRVLLAIDY